MMPGCGEDLEHGHRVIMQSQLGSLETQGFVAGKAVLSPACGLDKTATHVTPEKEKGRRFGNGAQWGVLT